MSHCFEKLRDIAGDLGHRQAGSSGELREALQLAARAFEVPVGEEQVAVQIFIGQLLATLEAALDGDVEAVPEAAQ